LKICKWLLTNNFQSSATALFQRSPVKSEVISARISGDIQGRWESFEIGCLSLFQTATVLFQGKVETMHDHAARPKTRLAGSYYLSMGDPKWKPSSSW
jgi:hypothetical protein